MTFILGITVTLSLTVAGYIYLLKYYFGDISKGAILAFDLKWIIYIAVSVLAGTGVCLTYSFLYRGTLIITQIKLITLVMLLIPIAVIDYKQCIIPNNILVAGLALRIIFYIIEFAQRRFEMLDTLKYDAIGTLVIVSFFLVCMFVNKSSIGMGDVKLFGLMGLYQGLWGVMSSMFLSLFVAFILSIVLLLSKKRGRKDSIPFGPSILLGTYIAIVLTGI